MQLVNCLSPIRIKSEGHSDLGKFSYVPCGVCEVCKKRKVDSLIAKLEMERHSHPYCYFVTLTYSEENVPYMTIDNNVSIDSVLSEHRYGLSPSDDKKILDLYTQRSMYYTGNVVQLLNRKFYNSVLPESSYFLYDIHCRFSFAAYDGTTDIFLSNTLSSSQAENPYLSSQDFRYFNLRDYRLPVLNKHDVQNFIKRLRKYIYGKSKESTQVLRYYAVGEYGESTFRPHYHLLLFCDTPVFEGTSRTRRYPDLLTEIVSETWSMYNKSTKVRTPIGRVSAERVTGAASSYVSGYVCKSACLPSIYKQKYIRPFSCFSKAPALGSMWYTSEIISKVISDCSPRVILPSFAAASPSLNVTPLSNSLENRLFPRIPRHSEFSLDDRVTLVESFLQSIRHLETSDRYDATVSGSLIDFDGYWRSVVASSLDSKLSLPSYYMRLLFQTETSVVKLYYTIRHIEYNLSRFQMSVRTYLEYVDTYYTRKFSLKMSDFVSLQNKYINETDDFSVFYPELVDKSHSSSLARLVSGIDTISNLVEHSFYKDALSKASKCNRSRSKSKAYNDYVQNSSLAQAIQSCYN